MRHMKLGRMRMVLNKLVMSIRKAIWLSMNVLEDNYQYGLTRPADPVKYTDFDFQINQRDYFRWLRSCAEFDPDRLKKELERYKDPDDFKTRVSPYSPHVCQTCGR